MTDTMFVSNIISGSSLFFFFFFIFIAMYIYTISHKTYHKCFLFFSGSDDTNVANDIPMSVLETAYPDVADPRPVSSHV